jgi:hypothetical protein
MCEGVKKVPQNTLFKKVPQNPGTNSDTSYKSNILQSIIPEFMPGFFKVLALPFPKR